MTDQNQGEINLQKKNISSRSWLKKVGISLVILSCVFYGALLLVPFTPLSNEYKSIYILILVILGEASFWLGGFILGREIAMKYRKYLNPLHWLKKKTGSK
ncbi:MAG: transporter suffix domain-containing protein [Firmicutes bacterium]|nr:transporter suffix domain-containing protein [Bacillota bacterium]